MAPEQRALLVRADATGTDGLAELNVQLERGWRVAHVTPMGGTGLDEDTPPANAFLAALVIIERQSDDEAGPAAVQALKQIEESEDEPDDIAEDVVEENGAGSPLSTS